MEGWGCRVCRGGRSWVVTSSGNSRGNASRGRLGGVGAFLFLGDVGGSTVQVLEVGDRWEMGLSYWVEERLGGCGCARSRGGGWGVHGVAGEADGDGVVGVWGYGGDDVGEAVRAGGGGDAGGRVVV